MTRTKITAIITATVLVVGSLYIGSNVLAPAEATVHVNGDPFPSALTACDPHNVKHWDKIIFQILRDPNGAINPMYLKTPLDIKVLDDPAVVANLDTKVRNFINTHGIAGILPPTPGTPPLTVADQLKIDIIDVEYAIVCVDTGLSNGGSSET